MNTLPYPVSEPLVLSTRHRSISNITTHISTGAIPWQRNCNFEIVFDSSGGLPAHRHRYGLAQVPTPGLRSVKPAVTLCHPSCNGQIMKKSLIILQNVWDCELIISLSWPKLDLTTSTAKINVNMKCWKNKNNFTSAQNPEVLPEKLRYPQF